MMIQMTMEEWSTHQEERRSLEKQLMETNTKLAAAEAADPSGKVQHLVSCVAAAREVVRFAIAHLAPETVRGWPHEQLTLFANLLESSPGATTDYKEMAIDLRDFARQAARLEEARRSGRYYPDITFANGSIAKHDGEKWVLTETTKVVMAEGSPEGFHDCGFETTVQLGDAPYATTEDE